jgi:hypothetical protein
MQGKSKRILVGCGIGCGAMLLLAIVLAVVFGTWISGKGELLEPQRLLGEETTGYAEWTLRLEDPGTDGFVQLLIEALDDIRSGQADQMPSWLRQVLMRKRGNDTAEEIREMFPVVIAWTMAPGDESDQDEMLFTVSPTGIGNRLVFADWIVGVVARFSGEGFIDKYRDEKIFRMPSGKGQTQTFFLRSGTIFFTTDLDSAKVAVDRLQAEDPGQRKAGPLDPLFAETRAEQTMRGAISSNRGEIPRLWQEIAGDDGAELMQALRSVTLDGGLQEDGSLVTTLRFRGTDRDWANAHADQLRELVESYLAESDLDLKVSSTSSGDVVNVEVRFNEIIDTLQRMFEEQQRRSGVKINL